MVKVKGWLRDTAKALLELGWSGTREDIINEFKKNPFLYPQASSVDEDRVKTSINSIFSKHSSTGCYKDKDRQIIFRHLDGDSESNKGHWELIFYDTQWDDRIHVPNPDVEYEQIDRFYCNRRTMKYLIGIDEGDEPGHVYAIVNSAWRGWIKVGKSGSISSRLSSYQTGSPHRDYGEIYSKFFPKCGFAEKQVHSILRRKLGKGLHSHEWFYTDLETVKSVIDSL